jgi:hypothetical protein
MWYIAVVAMFANFILPLHSVYQSEYFSSETACIEYLSQNSAFLYDSLTKEFPQYENQGKTYELESIILSCEYYNLVDA